MLKHRYIVILFLMVVAMLLALDYAMDISFMLYMLVACIFIAIEVYGASAIHSGFHLEAICQINTSDKVIALTFDDGPASETEKVLRVLNEFGVKATFFCIGHRISGAGQMLQKITREGHLLANHSYSHNHLFDLKNTDQMEKDLEAGSAAIQKASGRVPLFFRPPYGVTTPAMAKVIKKLNYTVIGWNIRSLDTSIKDRVQLLTRIQKRLKPGSILLMHDTVKDIDLVLRELLVYLRDNNYKIIELDKLIQKNAYA